jgi:hypothetical protein
MEDTMIERNLEYIKLQWADIHHSRQQEWKALVVIAGIFVAMGQIAPPDNDSLKLGYPMFLGAQIFLGLMGVLSAYIGARISWEHHKVFLQKISMISKLERQIGIQYAMRTVRCPVQVWMFLLFGAICSAFVGMTAGFGAMAKWPEAIGYRLCGYGIGVVFFIGFVVFAYVRRRKAIEAISYDYSHPFYAKMADLERCLEFLGDVPLKLIAGSTLDQPGIKEVPWESPKWSWQSDYKTITKPVLLNRRDVFQFSLANADSRQDWHQHEHTFEVYVSDHSVDLDYEEQSTTKNVHIDRGVLVVPPGVCHRVGLKGNTFVFQATLAGNGLGEDKRVCK